MAGTAQVGAFEVQTRRILDVTESGSPCRYEYRVWGADLRAQCEILRGAPRRGGSRRSEHYILATGPHIAAFAPGAVSAKIRGARLETKELMALHLDLQRWRPRNFEPFPIDRATLRMTICPALSLAPEQITDERYDRTAFLDRLIAPAPHLTAIAVEKTRHDFLVDDVRAEFTAVTVGSFAMQTVAVEAADADQTLRAANQLQLTGMPNRSYPEALQLLQAGGQTQH